MPWDIFVPPVKKADIPKPVTPSVEEEKKPDAKPVKEE